MPTSGRCVDPSIVQRHIDLMSDRIDQFKAEGRATAGSTSPRLPRAWLNPPAVFESCHYIEIVVDIQVIALRFGPAARSPKLADAPMIASSHPDDSNAAARG
jgi:hypothetical protein